MNVTFVSRDLAWTEPMEVWATHKIALPLRATLASEKFDLSVHWELTRGNDLEPKYEMWAVLQTYDGYANQMVRCRGNDFCNLVDEVSKSLRAHVHCSRRSRRFSLNPFRMLMEAP